MRRPTTGPWSAADDEAFFATVNAHKTAARARDMRPDDMPFAPKELWWRGGEVAGVDLVINCDDRDKLMDAAEYPAHLAKAVEAVNFPHRAVYRRHVSLMTHWSKYDHEVFEGVIRGDQDLRIWRGSDGYTRNWSDWDCGFVKADRAG